MTARFRDLGRLVEAVAVGELPRARGIANEMGRRDRRDALRVGAGLAAAAMFLDQPAAAAVVGAARSPVDAPWSAAMVAQAVGAPLTDLQPENASADALFEALLRDPDLSIRLRASMGSSLTRGIPRLPCHDPERPALDGRLFYPEGGLDKGRDGQLSTPGVRPEDRCSARHDPVPTTEALNAFFRFGPGDTAGRRRIFVPGLNTPENGPNGTEHRLAAQLAPVLDVGFAQLQTGTYLGMGPLRVPMTPQIAHLARPTVLEQIPARIRPRVEDGHLVWHERQRDYLEVALEQLGAPGNRPFTTEMVESLKAELRRVEDPDSAPLELWGYSRGAVEVGIAVGEYVAEYAARHGIGYADAKRAVGEHLAERVTIVTYGNAFRGYEDFGPGRGPRLLHVFTDRDPLTLGSGVHPEHPEGAGSNAAFVTLPGIFAEGAFENHNLHALGAGGLALLSDLAGVEDVAELFEARRTGRGIPRLTAEEMKAMFVLTGGSDWLWDPSSLDATTPLPGAERARAIVDEALERRADVRARSDARGVTTLEVDARPGAEIRLASEPAGEGLVQRSSPPGSGSRRFAVPAAGPGDEIAVIVDGRPHDVLIPDAPR